MYYTIYKITNKMNGKVYIGSHKTRNLDDKYMGSGKYLLSAIKKHGKENFTKEILFMFDNPEDMYAKEAELVNDEFLSEANTYNLKRGGFGGFDYLNSSEFVNPTHSLEYLNLLGKKGRPKAVEAIKNNFSDPEYSASWGARHSKIMRQKIDNGYEVSTAQLCTQNANEKRKETYKKNNHQQGVKNSQFGKRFKVVNNSLINKKVLLTEVDEYLQKGWKLGFLPK